MKVYLLKNGKKMAKKKTSNKHEDRNPIFNESMSFSVTQESLEVSWERAQEQIEVKL